MLSYPYRTEDAQVNFQSAERDSSKVVLCSRSAALSQELREVYAGSAALARGGAEGPAQRGSGSAARGASAAPSTGLLRDRPKGHGRCAVLCLPVAALSSSAADTAAAGVLGGDGWVTAQALTQQRQGDPSARVARAAAGLCGDTLSQFL